MSDSLIQMKTIKDIKTLPSELQIDARIVYHELKEVEKTVQGIIEKVMNEGDSGLRVLTEQFDHCRITDFIIPNSELECAWHQAEPEFRNTVEQIVQTVRDFHYKQLEHSKCFARNQSILGEIISPIESVATYVPGGRASYPSSVIMTVVPAQIAGVKNILLLTPPNSKGEVSKDILAIAHYLGLNKIARVGGAQAIAAVAFGTKSIPRVDKVVGPGNIYVTVAKRLLYGIIGVDSLAGPSEVVIIADEACQPSWVALDLLAQAEHDPLSRAILFSTNDDVINQVQIAIQNELKSHSLPFAKAVPIYLFKVDNLLSAFEMTNQIAPEHLELCCTDHLRLLPLIRHAGAIFLGNGAPVALGDYGYGPNHVLPTMSGSRFSSPLSVRDFLKTSSYIFPQEGDPTLIYSRYARLAEREGFFFHRKSLLARISPHDRV
ncbi:MAG: histidinol dehydrogenase [Candidatus Atribacteria bacterium]|nr:histidinol dehydrogenase [Candidatus Atribacteria bacterium]